jgi:hypothetical protein
MVIDNIDKKRLNNNRHYRYLVTSMHAVRERNFTNRIIAPINKIIFTSASFKLSDL